MAINSTQITDYLYKKVGFGISKTDTSTAKYPFNESIASPLLTPGQYVWQQDYAIPVVTSAPSSNTSLNGSTIVSVYNTNTSAVVQATALTESVSQETWNTGITNWIPPSFGSGYQLKVYAGWSGASAAQVANFTNLPVGGVNNDSWFFDYQSGILNFADTNVPTAAANVSNVVYVMGAVYTGTLGITNYANLNVTGNLTSINGNVVLTNGNVYAQNYYGTFQGTIGGSITTSQANVAYYEQITPLSNNQTYYLKFANLTTGNSITGAVTSINVNPSTGTISALAFAGGTGAFTTLNATSSTQATSTSSGALIVTGGAGIGANLYVGGNAKIAGNLEVDGTLTYLNTTVTQLSGSEVVAGTLQANSGTASTNTTSGALQVLGGAGVTGSAYIGGGIQNTPVGNTTPNTGAFTTLSASGLVSFTNATQNTGAGTGAFQISGGAYIAGNLFVGGNINLSQANVAVVTGNSSTFFGNASGFGALYAGIPSGYVPDGQTVTQETANFNGYAGIVNGQNLNSGPLASADIFLTPDNGTYNDTYLDIGIASSTYNYPGYTLLKPNDAYVFNWGNATTGGGNLIIGTGAVNDIIFAVQGINANNEVMRITRANVVAVKSGIASTSTTTGALTVSGGVGVTGAIYAGSIQNTPIGSTTASSATFTSVTAQTESVGGLQAVAIGNVTPGTAVFTTASTGGLQAVAIGNVTPGTGAFTTLTGGSFQGIIGNVTPTTAFFTTANATNVYAATIGNVGTTLNGTLSATGVSGTVATANASIYAGVTNNTSGGTYYPMMSGQSATGNAQAQVNGSLSYVPNTGTLSAVAFNGSGTSYIQVLQVNGQLSASGAIIAGSGASSTSTGTGALQVVGGAGITGNAYVGGNVVIGTALNYVPANAPVQVGFNTNGYSQFSIQNANAGNNASTDIAAVANNGSDNDTYVDMGIISSTYNQSAYSLYKPNDGYLIVAGNTTTGGGNLILNTYQKNDIIFATGGTTTAFEVARITSGNVLVVKSTNPNSLSANTGALQVWGGASFSGNTYTGGSSYQMGGALFNHNQASAGTTGGTNQNAVIIQGVNDSTLLYAKPLTAYDAVIIGGNGASTSFAQGAKLIINSTDSILLPAGTNAQRPGSSGGTDTTGMLRYSTTANSLEFYNGTAWTAPASTFTVVADQQFTGTGSQTIFTLSSSQTTNSCIVSINGIIQIPTLAYSVSGTSLTFTEAPLGTDVIDVRMITTTATVTGLSDTSGYNQVNVVTGTGVQFVTGTSSPITQYTIDVNGGLVTNGSNVTIASAGTSVIDNLYANSYSSAKYTITATLSGTNIREITEVLMIHTGNGAGAGSIYMTSYGRVNTAGNTLVTYSGATSGNIAQLQATTTNANTILRIKRDYMAL